MTLLIGVHKLIDARWTCIFELHDTAAEKNVIKAHILFYGRNCYEGYRKDYPDVILNEEKKNRVVVSLEFEGKIYEVKNPQFIFDYGAGND